MKAAELQMRSTLNSIDRAKLNPKNNVQTNATANAGINFADILNKQVQETDVVKFSAHAVKRLEERALMVSPHELERLSDGIKQLDEKGSKNSLVMVDDTAFVVSVSNKTVITALDKNASPSNVFTNIDSVAFV